MVAAQPAFERGTHLSERDELLHCYSRDLRATEVIANALRNPDAPVGTSSRVSGAELVAAASRHRVLALLGAVLHDAGTLQTWPQALVQRSLEGERAAAALEQVRQLELTRVLAALTARGLPVLVFKGAALARTHYPAPHLRSRTDTDLLVKQEHRDAVEETFFCLGYRRQVESSGEFVSHQSHYAITDRFGAYHPFDVHWKISNRHALADSLTFADLWERRRRIGGVSTETWTLCPVDALLAAAVHRAGHHPGSQDLLWAYDVHLLASRLTGAELDAAAELARSYGLGRIVCETLALAHRWFGTLNAGRLAVLIGLSSGAQERVVGMEGGTLAGTLLQDVQALPTWRQRLSLVREHVLPPASYMREKYGVRSSLLLPALYGWRVIAGAPRWLRRPELSPAPPR
jgi:hypothetical protein